MSAYEELVERCAQAMCDDGCNWHNGLVGVNKKRWRTRARKSLAEVRRTLKAEVAAWPSDMSHSAEQAKAFIREWLLECSLSRPRQG
jgi:hypothetical protein